MRHADDIGQRLRDAEAGVAAAEPGVFEFRNLAKKEGYPLEFWGFGQGEIPPRQFERSWHVRKQTAPSFSERRRTVCASNSNKIWCLALFIYHLPPAAFLKHHSVGPCSAKKNTLSLLFPQLESKLPQRYTSVHYCCSTIVLFFLCSSPDLGFFYSPSNLAT